jgi:hypothetical protein
MKKSFLLIFFILLSTFNYTVNGVNYWVWPPKDHIQVLNLTNSVEIVRLSNDKQKKWKITKKDLKDEIKRRKKYHKSLLSVYNESFKQEHLDLLANNSKQLLVLREFLKKW